jgi:hypothetical protein
MQMSPWLTSRRGKFRVGVVAETLATVPRSSLNHGQPLQQNNGGAGCVASAPGASATPVPWLLVLLLFPGCPAAPCH